MKRPSPATAISLVALFFSLGGVGLAAGHYLITAKSQIKPSVLRSLRGPRGKAGANGLNGATGAAGSAGATGQAGPAVVYQRTDLHYTGAATDPAPGVNLAQLEAIGTFTKLTAGSAITLVWTSHATGGNGNFCQYQLRIDGRTDQGSASTTPSSADSAGAVIYDTGSPFSVTDVFTGLAAGPHVVTVWDRGTASSCTDNFQNFGHDVWVSETP